MNEASEAKFYAALCAIGVVALTLVFVSVGVMPSLGLLPKGPGQRAGNVEGQTQGSTTRVSVFRQVRSSPPVPRRL